VQAGLALALELRLALVIDYTGDAPAARRAIDAANAHTIAVMEAASALVGYDAPAFASGYRGAVAYREGRLEDALHSLEWGIERARTRGATEVVGWLLGLASGVWLERGDFSRASRTASESLEIAERIESPLSLALAAGQVARVREQEGDLDAAVALAAQCVEGSWRTSRSNVPGAMCMLADLRLQRGERDEALRLADEALRIAEAGGFRHGQLAAELSLARIALDAAKDDDAASWLTRAEESLRATGQRMQLPELLELRAECARQLRDAAGREQTLREALRLYQDMGAAGHAERLARELAA
jgi:tetratricopeptide (TPR) repeat protein